MKRAVLLAVLVLLVVVPACQKRAAGPTVRVAAAPGFDLAQYPVIGFLGLGKAVAGEDAIPVMEPIFEAALQEGSLPEALVVLPREEVARRARAQGAAAVYNDVLDFWRDAKKVDRFKLDDLCTAIGVDALLVGSVEDWTRNEISWGAEGTSFTRVSLSLSLFACGSARSVWSARCSEMIESVEHEPSDIMGAGVPQGAERVARRTGGMDPGAERAQRAVPPPPPFEEIGPVVAAALVAQLGRS